MVFSAFISVASILIFAFFLLDCGGSGEPECPEPEPHEQYCINPNKHECEYITSYCESGEWKCDTWREHPPPMPEFEDWAWRCEVYVCNAWGVWRYPVPTRPPEDWPEPEPYVPPDPDELTGEWRLVADSQDIVPNGCEKMPRHYARANSLAVDPDNPNVMYLGMALTESLPSYWAAGVFKSVDKGETWFEARAGLGSHCGSLNCDFGPDAYRLYMDPEDSQVLFASTTERGLYRTADGGRMWDYVESFDCRMPGPIARGPNGVYHGACGGGRYISRDGGVTWEYAGTLGDLSRFITSFGFDERYPDRVWAGMCEGFDRIQGEGYIFLSEDGGETWTEMGQDIDAECRGYGGTWSVSVCGADPQKMAASVWYCGLFLSDDGGQSWYRAAYPVDGDYTLTASYATDGEECILYAGSSVFGAYRSEDNGKSWTKEFEKPLDFLFFDPFATERIVGLCIIGMGNSFELWIRE